MKDVLYYSLWVWFKKPQIPESGFYTYHKESQIRTISIFFAILIALESAGFHFLISSWSEGLAWVVLALNVYAFLYLIALMQSVRYLPILLDDKRLVVRVGLQSRIVIPLGEIASIDIAKPLDFGQKPSKTTYLAYLRTDTPQFEIRLKRPIPMIEAYGRTREISAVVVRVDRPQEFSAELERLIAKDEA